MATVGIGEVLPLPFLEHIEMGVMESQLQQLALVAALGDLQIPLLGDKLGGEGHQQCGGETSHTVADFEDAGPQRVLASRLHPVADL